MGDGRLPASTGNRGRDSRPGTAAAAAEKKNDAYEAKLALGRAKLAPLDSHARDFGWSVTKVATNDSLGRPRKDTVLYKRGDERITMTVSLQTGAVTTAVYQNPDRHEDLGGSKAKKDQIRWLLSGRSVSAPEKKAPAKPRKRGYTRYRGKGGVNG